MLMQNHLLDQVRRIVETEDRDTALKAVVALLKEKIPYYDWVGIYLVEGAELVLHNFLGRPTPHTRIPVSQGICGAAVGEKESIIVPDVNADPRYLSCSIHTKSEIVVPILRGDQVFGEIDIDSDQPDAFHEEDRRLLEEVSRLLLKYF